MTARVKPLMLGSAATRSAAAFLDAVREVSATAFANAPHVDRNGALPVEDIFALSRIGALIAPSPRDLGGRGLTRGPLLLETLRLIGHGSLPLGRLYEGHVNALGLIQRFGTPSQIARAAGAASRGLLFGVWNTEAPPGLQLERRASGWQLLGGKTFASGAGLVARPLITAMVEGRQLMVLPRLEDTDQNRADLSSWQSHGMRASATGSFDFTGIAIDDDDVIGVAGDYHRQPSFSGGAWRFTAVQLGGIERLVDELRAHLVKAGRDADPQQRARFGTAVMAAETARLWVQRAADVAEHDGDDDGIIAYVNFARLAVERAGLDVIELAQRCIGLAGFHQHHPIEHVYRDLATYLRQPAPDKALDDASGHVLGTCSPIGGLWR